MVAALGAAVVGLGTVHVAATQDAPRPLDAVAVVVAVGAALALGWRRRVPLLALAANVALVGGYLLAGYPYGPIQLCMVVAMFEVARRRELRVSLPACAAAVAGTAAALLARAILPADVPVLLLAVWASWLVVPWSVGALVQARTAAAQRALRELAAEAALAERVRIASEVHDVAGHAFSAVAMQARVALLVFDEDPPQTRRSLEAIQATSATALGELRTMLDVLPGSAQHRVGRPAWPGSTPWSRTYAPPACRSSCPPRRRTCPRRSARSRTGSCRRR